MFKGLFQYFGSIKSFKWSPRTYPESFRVIAKKCRRRYFSMGPKAVGRYHSLLPYKVNFERILMKTPGPLNGYSGSVMDIVGLKWILWSVTN